MELFQNPLDYNEVLNIEETEVYEVEDDDNVVGKKRKIIIEKKSYLEIENEFFNFMLNHESYTGD